MLSILRASNASDEEKAAALHAAQAHLTAVQLQREYYNAKRDLARAQTTMTVNGVEHKFQVLSFNFAEQVNKIEEVVIANHT